MRKRGVKVKLNKSGKIEFWGGYGKYIKKEVKISILLSTYLNIPTGKENIKLNYWSLED